ncbi:hypothetical protein PbB2_00098 [Candidatus Phycosocius bacilliformis]|uniref:Bacteriophage tail tape measure C-terminal domain-containing protein n=1 Tax=Candidatus Phycosocius bacilliformis TaxID=1445552 RepID=A0A2P2E5W5_9PROT|nr:phage tail tape measure C-terminal domain-containing protein [Candidatus Phycosocius bacilliformis]GBF56442.1 hypothetical protein PbB2_00098 [Candidatus Phycosocius bacilliformis]
MAKPVNIKLRIEAENADAVKKALEGLGVTGQSAMKKLEAAAKAARPETKALAAAADDLKGRMDGLGQDIPGVSAALRGLGPAGAVAAGAFALVASAVAAGMTAAREYMTWAADLTDAADAVQTNVESLQAWRFAMEEVGGTSQDLDAGLAGLNSTIGALKTGLGDVKQVAALKELGLDPEVVRSWNNLEDALPAIVRGFEGVKDEATRVRIAERLGIKELLPLLRLGSDGLGDLEQRASDLGVTVDKETVAALDAANRRLEIVTDRIRGQAAPAVVMLAEAMADIGEAAANAIAPVLMLLEWVSKALDKTWALRMAVSGLPGIGMMAGQMVAASQGDVRRMPKGGRGGGGGDSQFIDDVIQENRRRNTASYQGPRIDIGSGRSGGSGRNRGNSSAAREAAQAVRDAAEAVRRSELNQREMDRAQLDILRATEALAKSSAERRAISEQRVTLERDQALAAINADKELDETTKAQKRVAVETAYQADLAKIASEAWEELGQQLEEQKRRDETSRRLIEDAELSMLESASQNAKTRQEALAIEIKILDLVTARQLAEIEALEASEEAKALARAAVEAAKAAQQEVIKRQNQSPLERYGDTLKRERDNINDSLESIAVGGLQSLEDGLTSIIDGTKSVKQAFSDMARSILAELTRLAIRQWIIKPLLDAIKRGGNGSGDWFGGGRALGGPVMAGASYIVGERGPERFVPALPGYIQPSNSGSLKVNIYNAPTPASVQPRADGGVDIIFQRLDQHDQRLNQLDQSIEGRALGAYSDARRRGYF